MATSSVAAIAKSKQTARSVQQSTLVVNGLDPSRLSAEYLDLLNHGGVNCWHHSVGGDFASFARLLEFCDRNKGRITPAGSARDIRELHSRGIISHIAGWQSATLLSMASPRLAICAPIVSLGCGSAVYPTMSPMNLAAGALILKSA